MMSVAGDIGIKPPDAPPAPRVRYDVIEWIRVAAACGVVWFHIKEGPFKEIGHAGLVCFVLITVVFQASGACKEEFPRYFGKRSVRILTPWLFWMVFYGLSNLVKGREFFPHGGGVLADVLAGTWIGLWYLPFVLILSPCVYVLARGTRHLNPLVSASAFLVTGILMLYWLPGVEKSLAGRVPWSQWTHALPAFPIGLGLHALVGTAASHRVVAMAVFLILLEGVCWHLSALHRDYAIPHGLASLVVGAGFLVRSSLPQRITRLGGLCLGVYLLHSAVISALRFSPVPGNQPWMLYVLTIIISFVAVSAMRRNPWLAKVL